MDIHRCSRTINLPDVPKRIFADAGACLGLWEVGSPPVGQMGYRGALEIPDELAVVTLLDLSGGELDVEAVMSLRRTFLYAKPETPTSRGRSLRPISFDTETASHRNV